MIRPVLTLATLVLVLALGDAWLAGRAARARAGERRVGALFTPEEAANLRKQPALRIEGFGATHAYGRVAGQWRCLSYHDAPADRRAVQALLDGIVSAEGLVHTSATEEAPAYGINTPQTLSVSIQGPRATQAPGGDVLATLKLGASAAGREGGFVRRKGTREIWSIASDLRAPLEQRRAPGLPPLLEPAAVPSSWREQGGAAGVVLEQDGKRRTLERRDSPPDPATAKPGAMPWKWFLEPGAEERELSESADAFVSFLENLPYVAVLERERRGELVPPPPRARVTLTGREGPPLVLEFGVSDAAGRVALWVEASQTLYQVEAHTFELAFPSTELLTAAPAEKDPAKKRPMERRVAGGGALSMGTRASLGGFGLAGFGLAALASANTACRKDEAEPAAPVQEAAAAPAAPGTPAAPVAPAAGFVDESLCAACHPKEAEAWRGSHHQLAMQPATSATVLGDFADARFEDGSTDTLFTRDGEAFVVETEGPDGQRARFAAPYVFGIDPLQQVLLELPKGRLQALSVAWDPAARRWFSLYPGEHIDARDPLHWTRAPQNWNFSCAECHATNLRRNYDPAHDAYATTWNRLDVGCQACHGPGERHVTWVSGAKTGQAPERSGFDAPRDDTSATREIETCARCHARRAPLGDGSDLRHRLLDDYLPALLSEGLYYADGQIQDEVYEYGSFLQSKMHARGVRCSDCHEPHALKPRAPGNLLCTSCHSPTPAPRPEVDLTKLQRKNYDTSEHHHHAPGTPGSQCVDCHMPTRTYMIVDPRRDHGFRVPRPDLAAETGAPDVCARCHAERDAAWSAARIAEWSGPVQREAHFGSALQAARTGRAGAVDGLLALLRSDAPAIVRATALTELERYPSQVALAAAAAALADADGLVRLAAVSAFEILPPEQRVGALGALLRDPLRGVRTEAARLVAGVEASALGPFQAEAGTALAEYEAIQRGLLERPEAHLNLAQLALARGERARAEAELTTALRIDPLFVPAYVNLSDLLRTTKGEGEAEGWLRDGLGRAPDAAALHHALGLALVRQQRNPEGLAELARAAELAPEDPRFGYVHAIALHDGGQKDAALAALRGVLARHAGDRDARFALSGYLHEAGDDAGARRCLTELAAINPYDPGLAEGVAPPSSER